MHEHLMALIIGDTCVGVFVATAVISILSLVKVITIDPQHANRLFQVLIVQVVVIGVGTFAGLIKFDPQPVQQRLDQATQDQKELAQTQKAIQAVRQDAIAATSPTTGGATASAQAVPDLQPRVYIQIASDAQRDAAQKAQAALRQTGAIVPPLENVGAKSPNSGELRYFNAADAQKAQDFAQSLQASGIVAKPVLVEGIDPTKIRPEHFELWFPKT